MNQNLSHEVSLFLKVIFKNKEKEAILCKAGAIYTAQGIFRSFKHATVA